MLQLDPTLWTECDLLVYHSIAVITVSTPPEYFGRNEALYWPVDEATGISNSASLKWAWLIEQMAIDRLYQLVSYPFYPIYTIHFTSIAWFERLRCLKFNINFSNLTIILVVHCGKKVDLRLFYCSRRWKPKLLQRFHLISSRQVGVIP